MCIRDSLSDNATFLKLISFDPAKVIELKEEIEKANQSGQKLKQAKEIPPVDSTTPVGHIRDLFDFQSLSLFSPEVLPSDIHQGELGDCYLLGSLSALSSNPLFIERLFIQNQINPCGKYGMLLCVDGEWQLVEFDDMLPLLSNRQLAYAQIENHKIWVPLVEKAFATIFGSYRTIVAGSPSEAMNILTGAPCVSFTVEDILKPDPENMWEFILSYKEKGFFLTVSYHDPTQEDPSIGEEHKSNRRSVDNAVINHSYTLLSAKVDSKGRRLVTIRNPWAKNEMSGALDHDSLEVDVRKDMVASVKDEGSIVIDLSLIHI
eukprot:TRINITY_DN6757_c0_g1_i1.p1 TRINITY_DN6757_c0_g1~~TRINITY_DN6757_c0_g1_i1.p1  ORF type:complete len:348 (-),score=64.50 TRINITY_DN6757_c0_g1_i1:60-1016(-)